jgi:glycosyltransferase involved in cell wall biosynthesis
MMRKLLWIGDAVCDSGFAKCTHKILEEVAQRFEVSVLGINYRGKPHDYPYKIWPAGINGDLFGVRAMLEMCDKIHPDVIVLQNDPWNVPAYVRELSKLKVPIPTVGIMAVDAPNCLGRALNGLHHVIFWTEFAREEAYKGGLTRPSGVCPLGVDTDVFYPQDKIESRRAAGLPDEVINGYIVGNINRNQPRKRMDLTIRYFAEWMKTRKVPDAFLWLHVCPTGDTGFGVEQLAKYYGIGERIILVEPEVWKGVAEKHIALTLNCFDVQMSTTQGEGWGLTTMEGMACGTPQIVPDWSALGEWAREGAMFVPVTSTACTLRVNAIGGIADETQFIEALDLLYRDAGLRGQFSESGLRLVMQDKYRWPTIAKQYAEEIEACLAEQALPV